MMDVPVDRVDLLVETEQDEALSQLNCELVVSALEALEDDEVQVELCAELTGGPTGAVPVYRSPLDVLESTSTSLQSTLLEVAVAITTFVTVLVAVGVGLAVP